MLEKTRSKGRGREQENVTLTIFMMGKKKEVVVPKGIRLQDAIKAAGVLDYNQWSIKKLNGSPLKENENPTLEENSTLVLAQPVKGG